MGGPGAAALMKTNPAQSILASATWCLKVWHFGASITRLPKNGFLPNHWTRADAAGDSGFWNLRTVDLKGLFSAGMGLALVRKTIVGPCIPAFRYGRGPFAGCRGSAGSTIPVLWGIGNSPDIFVVVQRQSDKKIFAVVAQRQTTCHAARSGSAAWQFTQQHRSLKGQGLRGPESAALGTDYNDDALGGERMPAIHAGDNNRNVNAQSRAAPGRFWCRYFHG